MFWYSLSHAMFANAWYSSYWAGLRVVVVAGWWCHLSNDLGFRSSRPKKISISAGIIGVGQPGRERKEASSCASLPSSSSSPSRCVRSVASPPTKPTSCRRWPSIRRPPPPWAAMFLVRVTLITQKLSFLFFFFCLYQSNMLKPKGILASLYQSKNFSFAEGYFVGRPMNHAEPAKEQQQGTDEQRPAANAQIPGGTCNRASSIWSNFGHKRISFARCFAELCFVFVLCNRFGTPKWVDFVRLVCWTFASFSFFGGRRLLRRASGKPAAAAVATSAGAGETELLGQMVLQFVLRKSNSNYLDCIRFHIDSSLCALFYELFDALLLLISLFCFCSCPCLAGGGAES